MASSIVVYGASGHGKVVADAARAAGLTIEGFLDDDPAKRGTPFFGASVLGGREWLREATPRSIAWGIGSNHVRARLAPELEALGHRFATIVHPRAAVSPTATVGAGAVVFANAAINPDATIGPGAIVNTGAVVEHDCVVGSYAHLSPNAALGGGVRVGACAHLGVGVSVIPLVTIGEGTTVGAGSVVVRDLPPQVIAFGVPARVHRSQPGA
jgi:sugar O-acyltransferase (sialic acid O-acetyltransferase NeuD family)